MFDYNKVIQQEYKNYFNIYCKNERDEMSPETFIDS